MSRETFKRAAKQQKRREESEAKAARPAPRATLVKKAAHQKAPRAIPVKSSPKDPRSRVNTVDELTAVEESIKEDKKKRAAAQRKYKAANDNEKRAMLRAHGPAGRKYYEGK